MCKKERINYRNKCCQVSKQLQKLTGWLFLNLELQKKTVSDLLELAVYYDLPSRVCKENIKSPQKCFSDKDAKRRKKPLVLQE